MAGVKMMERHVELQPKGADSASFSYHTAAHIGLWFNIYIKDVYK